MADPWLGLFAGYAASVMIETPVLVMGLSPRHSPGRRVFAGVWLTTCSYPVVVLVLPILSPGPRWLYLMIAEPFAIMAECALFWIAFGETLLWGSKSMGRDFLTIALANLASFGAGELWYFLFARY